MWHKLHIHDKGHIQFANHEKQNDSTEATVATALRIRSFSKSEFQKLIFYGTKVYAQNQKTLQNESKLSECGKGEPERAEDG